MATRRGMKPIRYVMAAARPLNSAGQSASLVMRKSAVRIRKGAQTLTLHFGGGFVPRIRSKTSGYPLARVSLKANRGCR